MRFGYSLTFPIHDGHWFRKIFLPAILLLVPLLGPVVVLGWGCEVCRRAIEGKSEELPDLDFRKNLSDGIRVLGLLVLHGLPVLVAAGAGALLASPYFVSQKDSAAAGVAAALCAIECVGLLITLALAALASAAIGRYAAGENLGAALRPIGSLRLLRSAPGAYLLTLLGYVPLALLALSGGLICLIGACFTGAYATASAFHLIGQAYRSGRSLPAGPAIPAAGG